VLALVHQDELRLYDFLPERFAVLMQVYHRHGTKWDKRDYDHQGDDPFAEKPVNFRRPATFRKIEETPAF
jgi:hypothetical protein